MLKLRSIPVAVLVVFAAWLLASCADTSDFLVEKTHPDGWNSASSETFHGKFVLESASPSESCQSCHGQDYGGGTSGVSCATCHSAYPHPEGFAVPSSIEFHEAVFQDMADWDITKCQTCHGGDYGREIISVQVGETISCLTCHAGDDGPEECSTCHGGAQNDAPPQDLMDNTATTASGVGAHQQHLAAQIAESVECSECHVEPDDFDDPEHVLSDATPGMAELVFGTLATHDGVLNPAYDFATSTCGNSYCHGGFAFAKADAGSNSWGYAEDFIRGNNPNVVWSAVGTGEAKCGSCHSLPPVGHIPAAFVCSTCHVGVTDQQNNILDPTLHINGEKDLFWHSVGGGFEQYRGEDDRFCRSR